jgi:Flp pilus assembly protein TadG
VNRVRRAAQRLRRPSWTGRSRERARGERGIAVVEAAFITPVFFALVLGVAEIGLVMNDYLAEASAVRAGARVASTSGSDIYTDYDILKAINKDGAALADERIKQIVVYKPATFGEAPTATCQAGTPVANVCNVYTVADLSRPETDFGCLTTKNLDRYWCPSIRKTTLAGAGTDYVGVWMKIEHPWLTKMFGSTKTLTDSSVIRIEPRKKS